MTHRIICFAVALLCGLTAAWAQEPSKEVPSHANRVYLSIQGGPAFNLYENAFSYWENGRGVELFTLQGAAALGYDFSDSYGMRLQAAFGNDAGACNVRQTSGDGFYPYAFRHVNVFADAVVNLSGLRGKVTAFRPKLYAGIGGAYTFDFTDAGHPWQEVVGKNIVFGFRGGFIAEYTLRSGLGFLADFCGEAYTDMYNGLMPSEEDQKNYEGYGGFPLDLRGTISLGLVYHF